MRLNALVSRAIKDLIGWIIWRLVALTLIGLFALVALYHFTAIATLALEARVGAIYAHLMIGGGFVALALITLGILWATRKPALPESAPSASFEHRRSRVIMLVEALMLGFERARHPNAHSD